MDGPMQPEQLPQFTGHVGAPRGRTKKGRKQTKQHNLNIGNAKENYNQTK